MSNSSDDSILRGFSAETLLGSDAHVIKEITDLRNDLRYTTDGNQISLDDAFIRLQSEVDKLPRIVLDMDVPPGTENEYLIRLSTAQEKVLDDCDRVLRRILEYLSKLKNAERAVKKYKADFMAWYVLAASYVIAQHEVKFPPSQVKQLGEAEFSRLLSNLDVQIDNLISSVEHLIEEARQHKKIQSEKHSLGKDQANASWTSKMTNFGGIAPSRADDMAQIPDEEDEEEDDEVPAFVSRRPQVGHEPSFNPDLLKKLTDKIKDRDVSSVDDPNFKAFIGDGGGATVFTPSDKIHHVVASNQDLLDEAKPGDTVVLRFQDKVTTEIKDEVRIVGPTTLPLATPEEVIDFLNADEEVAVGAQVGAIATMRPRKKLILTEDEDLM